MFLDVRLSFQEGQEQEQEQEQQEEDLLKTEGRTEGGRLGRQDA